MTQLTLPLTASTTNRCDGAAAARPLGVRCRHYRIGPVPVSIHSDVPGAIDAYHALYRAYEVAASFPESLRIEVAVKRSHRSGRRYYHIRGGDEEEFIVRSRDRILPHVEAVINLLIARYLPDYLQIHASAVCRDGAAVVFPGKPGAGKTTLAAALLARGWSYCTDEFALIEPRTRLLFPYPKALSIKEGSLAILAAMGVPIDEQRTYARDKKGSIRCLDPLSVRPDAVAGECPVRMVVFPEYAPGGIPTVEPIPRAKAAFEMTRCCFNFLKFRARAVELLANVVRQAQCYRMRTGDLARSCELVETLFLETQRGKA
ncbi:MAG: hypothetical protein ABII12_14230 [Planctomycetota bacterium]